MVPIPSGVDFWGVWWRLFSTGKNARKRSITDATSNDLYGVRLVAGMRPGSMGGSQNFEEGADDAGTRRGHVHFDWKRSPRILRSTIITEKGNVILSAVSKEPKA
ncbi:hypothetical protein B296_00023310 [Ensete ventricosum]|uniref:Uncharacterized protein n=1 Tax=Ensete ventricosum TaxID=4639 RepID=A0A427A6G7_ENSVE|nr:hypothetical protein B296_00023310 [Ensete ventricosum]